MVQYDARTRPEAELRGQFRAVFVDPPWGRELLKRFLAAAAELACENATIAMTLPQLLTRPGVVEEREDLLKLANQMGLCLIRQLPSATEYQVPNFECAAYGRLD